MNKNFDGVGAQIAAGVFVAGALVAAFFAGQPFFTAQIGAGPVPVMNVAAVATADSNCRNLSGAANVYQQDVWYSNVMKIYSEQYSNPTFFQIYSTNLTGIRADIAVLHSYLEKDGFTIDAADKSSNSFGVSTARAVVAFQIKHASELQGEAPSGIVTKVTKDLLNQKFGCIDRAAIDLIAPKSGVTVSSGSKLEIKWVASKIPNATKLTIRYTKADGTGAADIATTSIKNGAGTYDWTIPTGFTPGSYKIALVLEGSTQTDASGAFSVVTPNAAPKITITALASGTTFTRGSNVSVTWTSSNLSANAKVKVVLVTPSLAEKVLAASVDANANTASVKIPDDAATGAGSKFKLVPLNISNLDGSSSLTSPAFTVALKSGALTATLSATEVYKPGKITVNWTSTGVLGTANVKATLVTASDNAAVANQSVTVKASVGSATFTLPGTLASTKYKVLLATTVDTQAVTAYSPEFTLKTPTFAVTQPSAGVTSLWYTQSTSRPVGLTTTITLNITPTGGSMAKLLKGDVAVAFVKEGTTTPIPGTISSVTTSPNAATASGSKAVVTIVATVGLSELTAGKYTAYLQSLSPVIGTVDLPATTYTSTQFTTNSQAVTK